MFSPVLVYVLLGEVFDEVRLFSAGFYFVSAVRYPVFFAQALMGGSRGTESEVSFFLFFFLLPCGDTVGLRGFLPLYRVRSAPTDYLGQICAH